MSGTTRPTQRRRSLRRAVHLDCALVSDLWQDSVPHLATDLSLEGVWLSSQLPLEPGTEVVVSFRPPRWPWQAPPLTTLAEVARVGLPRRRRDRHDAGMGLSFVAMDDGEREQLEAALRGLPPPLPRALRVAASPLSAGVESELVVDGVARSFVSEGVLLTAGAPRVQTLEPRSRAVRQLRRGRSYRYRPPHERIALLRAARPVAAQGARSLLRLVSGVGAA